MVELTIANVFTQWQESLFVLILVLIFLGLLWFLCFCVLGVAICFVWLIFCVLHRFEMPFVHIALAVTFQEACQE
jgi:nucleoside recognition membrane protein YjiH